MIHFRVRYERLRGRLGQVRRRAALFRAAWVALLVPLAGLLLRETGLLDLSLTSWALGAAAAFVATIAWQARRSTERQLDRELDRRFALDDLMVTAVEVDRRGPRTTVEGRLLDDAATAVATLGGERAIDSGAARQEAETVAALALVLVGAWLLAGTLRIPPPVERLPDLPGLATAGDTAALGTGPRPGSQGGGGSPGLRALADMLADHAAAREIAAALAAGDAAGAARSARSLADRAGELSPEGRRDLAELLHDAADAIESTDPGLAQAVRETARALESPDADTVTEGVDRLAAELDVLAARPLGSEGAPDSADHDTLGPLTRRLAVEPEQLSWPGVTPDTSLTRGRSFQSRAPDRAEAPEERVTGGVPRAGRRSTATDPLRYPWELRDAVREYFAPPDGGR